jgi:hypothetical protein
MMYKYPVVIIRRGKVVSIVGDIGITLVVVLFAFGAVDLLSRL